MSTPQNPGDGDTPQDPSDPQNPYGTPPPPPPPPPSDPGAPSTPPPSTPPPAPPTEPAPPSTPIPAAPAPYGDPSVPPGAPAAPPPYGEQPTVSAVPPAAPPYGQPGAPGQPEYAPPGYSPMPGPAEPSKGMAITALILSILGCTCIGALVAIPLAIIVLVRSKDGRNHGKGLAIAALIISVISLVGAAIGTYFLYDYAKDFKNVDDLKAGQCITAKGLTDESQTGVTQIKSVGCSSRHDGEVLSTSSLTAAEADSYGETSPVAICTPSVTAAGSVDLLTDPELVLIALTSDSSPASGDKLVCVIANADGSKLTSKLGS
jgi:hypothetical protein